jgi:uncharacterized protein (UPF0332 family)
VSGPALPLGRGREELRAAEALLEAGFPSQALSRAYFAGFHAATAALLVLGEAPSTRSGVVSAFGRRVIEQGGLEREVGRSLRKLFEDRIDVDYALADAPAEEAGLAIAEAERLVDDATRWIESRSGSRQARPG